ncbi:MAG: allophanate hydrolase subunit 1 [Pseudomonadota bacterium]
MSRLSLRFDKINPFTETGLLIMLAGGDSAERAMGCQHLARVATRWPGMTSVTPGLDSVALRYDPDETSFKQIRARLNKVNWAEYSIASNAAATDPIDVPICFDDPFAPDLAHVANRLHITIDEIIIQLTDKPIPVLNMGFAPGFAYVGGLRGPLADETALSRRSVPRTAVPAGSLALAAGFAGLYSCSTPGGWHVVGRTPIPLFNAHSSTPFVLKPGNEISLRTIDAQVFQQHKERTEKEEHSAR